jgi:hypothetical protein
VNENCHGGDRNDHRNGDGPTQPLSTASRAVVGVISSLASSLAGSPLAVPSSREFFPSSIRKSALRPDTTGPNSKLPPSVFARVQEYLQKQLENDDEYHRALQRPKQLNVINELINELINGQLNQLNGGLY